MVTEAEAQRLIAESKVIGVNLEWARSAQGYRLAATVMALDSEEILNLRGFIGKRNRSFVLLYRNTPIRKYTVHAQHKDPVTKIIVREPHKHTWDDEWGDQLVYIPDDIRIGNPTTN